MMTLWPSTFYLILHSIIGTRILVSDAAFGCNGLPSLFFAISIKQIYNITSQILALSIIRISSVTTLPIQISMDQIEAFSKKWKVKKLALFGSVLRKDFNPQTSDIDVLISFLPGDNWGWEIVTMKEELENIFHRKVDLIGKTAIEKSRNPIRKNEILNSYEVLYEQAA
jgi:predicted nucleotidyltransferase